MRQASRFTSTGASVRRASDGEIRGEFWDLGRLTEGDIRFSSVDFRPLLELMTQGRWPPPRTGLRHHQCQHRRGDAAGGATLRAIALAPERYENRSATVSGRFRGRNLLGDIATPLPTPGKWDFVLQSADAAVWVSALQAEGPGLRARSSARVDTGRWVQVAGTVAATAAASGSRAARSSSRSRQQEARRSRVPVPTPVGAAADGHLQHARARGDRRRRRDDRPRAVLARHGCPVVQGSRSRHAIAPPPQAAAPPPADRRRSRSTTTSARAASNSSSRKPLERFQTVKVELLEGITAVGGDAAAALDADIHDGTMMDRAGTIR